MMDCKLQVEINSFLVKLCLAMVFIIVIEKKPGNKMVPGLRVITLTDLNVLFIWKDCGSVQDFGLNKPSRV